MQRDSKAPDTGKQSPGFQLGSVCRTEALQLDLLEDISKSSLLSHGKKKSVFTQLALNALRWDLRFSFWGSENILQLCISSPPSCLPLAREIIYMPLMKQPGCKTTKTPLWVTSWLQASSSGHGTGLAWGLRACRRASVPLLSGQLSLQHGFFTQKAWLGFVFVILPSFPLPAQQPFPSQIQKRASKASSSGQTPAPKMAARSWHATSLTQDGGKAERLRGRSRGRPCCFRAGGQDHCGETAGERWFLPEAVRKERGSRDPRVGHGRVRAAASQAGTEGSVRAIGRAARRGLPRGRAQSWLGRGPGSTPREGAWRRRGLGAAAKLDVSWGVPALRPGWVASIFSQKERFELISGCDRCGVGVVAALTAC